MAIEAKAPYLAAVIPLGIAIAGTAEVFPAHVPHQLGVIALIWLACAALVGRHRTPAASAVIAMALMHSVVVQTADPLLLATPILVITLGAWAVGRYASLALGLLAELAMGLIAFQDVRAAMPVSMTMALLLGVAILSPYTLGLLARRADRRNRTLTARAERFAQETSRQRREAVRDERTRIARELHDVLAHSISAMVIQAEAAEAVLRTDLDRAATALHAVSETGRTSLAETGRLLQLLRNDDDFEFEPTATLRRLDALVNGYRANGLAVDVESDARIRNLPAAIDASAYRILEEALTNALKYATDRRASVRIGMDGRDVSIQVENAAGADQRMGAGLGLVGISERAHLFGGAVTHRLTNGVFALHARLPVHAS